VKCGDEIEFICEGPDEEEALAAMVSVVESKFGEKDN
jgi:phosphocarrier protein